MLVFTWVSSLPVANQIRETYQRKLISPEMGDIILTAVSNADCEQNAAIIVLYENRHCLYLSAISDSYLQVPLASPLILFSVVAFVELIGSQDKQQTIADQEVC